MEHLQDDSTDNDQAVKRSLEWYSSDKEEEKRKEKEEKAKKRRQQEREEASEKAEKQTKATEREKADEKKPSLLGMLIDGDKPKAETVKEQKSETEAVKPAEKISDASARSTETASTAETQKNPAELSPDEEREATLAYITARQIRLAAEVSEQPADDEKSTETRANQTFLQKLADKLRSNKVESTEEILDASADETIAEAIDSDELGAEEDVEMTMDEHGEATPETPLDNPSVVQEIDSPDYNETATVVPPSPPVPPSSGGSPAVSSGGASSSGGDGSSGGGYGPTGDMPSFGNSPEGSLRLTGQSASVVAETGSRGLESAARRTASGGEFLLGAFVGYLFGRRRGKIKAESEAEPVKRKLEQQVQDLQQKIETRETYVRSAVSHKTETTKQPEAESAANLSNKPEVTGEQKARAEQLESHDRQSSSEKSTAPEERAKQPFARSAEQAVAESLASMHPEQIDQSPAHVENKAVNQPERLRTSSAPPERSQPSPEAVLVLPLQEVLRGADKVPYHGESLRDLYESGRITERTLRETYRESLRGHRYEKQLDKSLQQNIEAVPRSPESLSEQASHTLTSEQVAQSNPTSNNSDENPTQPSTHQENPASADLPPFEIDPSARSNHFASLTPGQQATVGAVIGIVFVVIVLLFWPR